MGVYSEYLDRALDFPALVQERQGQLKRISELRGGRDVLVLAADLNKTDAPISIAYPDLLPIKDQLANLNGTAVDLILETPGGHGEVGEEIVRLLHNKYETVGVIIPGWAKSAGTIIAMAGNEILMDRTSALGPIDAQITWQGKVFSADALLEGMEKIKNEVEETDTLNKAYIPILQGISPGELQSAENALKFARVLVTEWLARYKFETWTHHSSTGEPVTEQEKRQRAEEIARDLCDHRRWLTHGRSIMLDDLEAMRLRITDYSKLPELSDAVQRYYTLLQITFNNTSIYKVFETSETAIYRFTGARVPAPTPQQADEANVAIIEMQCPKCKSQSRVQANLDHSQPLQEGCLPFPEDNKLPCPNCGAINDLSGARRQIEVQTKKRVVA